MAGPRSDDPLHRHAGVTSEAVRSMGRSEQFRARRLRVGHGDALGKGHERKENTLAHRDFGLQPDCLTSGRPWGTARPRLCRIGDLNIKLRQLPRRDAGHEKVLAHGGRSAGGIFRGAGRTRASAPNCQLSAIVIVLSTCPAWKASRFAAFGLIEVI